MPQNLERLRSIKSFPSLVKYLRDELDWPIETDDVEELSFDYQPEELGLDPKTAVKIKEIKQLRPFVTNQPWGIFYVNFEPKQLPIVALRRILRSLVLKKRASANKGQQRAWQQNDLLFISSYGETDEREITFAHFSEDSTMGDLPTLKVLGWSAGNTVLRLEDTHSTLKDKLHWPENEDDTEAWRERWSSAFKLRYRETVRTSKDLAVSLAELAGDIRARVNSVIEIESEKGELRKLYKAFQEALIHDLSLDDFADMYAQTIAYGLLTASISRQSGGLVADNLKDMVPNTNPFLKELMQTFLTVGGRQNKIDFDELGINEVVELLRHTQMDEVLKDFGAKNPQEDPVIHFYELFLKEYDPEKRMQRGVFYTPRPVVSFIVRSVDEILRTEFGLEDGLADTTTWGEMAKQKEELRIPQGLKPNEPFVQILDPATGTGTFLVEVIDVIFQTLRTKWQKQGKSAKEMFDLWNDYVPRHLLTRLNGFELMMAPYAIAHMKIGLKLRETRYSFLSSERARVYLTNTLEEPKDFSGYLEQLAPALAHEAEAANSVKRNTPVTVLIGNPPYSALSANLTPAARAIVDDYRFVNGERIRERSMLQFEKNIQDDYIKFIAKSQNLTAEIPLSVIGLITNHSYLDGPTLRGLRWNLINSFTDIDVLDLHGNSNKKEKTPDGNKDENVFDIQQGVAIAFMRRSMARNPAASGAAVRRSDLWGVREEKTGMLKVSTIRQLQRVEVALEPQFYFFVVDDRTGQEEWKASTQITSIFEKYSTGTETGFDDLLIDFDKGDLLKKVRRFVDSRRSPVEIKKEFSAEVGHASKLLSRRSAFDVAHWEKYLRLIQFRPFDYRYAYLKQDLLKTNSFNVMNELDPEHLGLVTTRQTKEQFGVLAIAGFCGHKCTSSYDRSYIFPLWISAKGGLLSSTDKRPAITREFLGQLSRTIKTTSLDEWGFPSHVSSSDVYHYIFSILSAPSYRKRYGEYLKREFPRIPLTSDEELFRKLCALGADLVALHLLEEDYEAASWNRSGPKGKRPFKTLLNRLAGKGDTEVAKGYPKYRDRKVVINPSRYFEGVPDEVWASHIGGYQVCEKWLKDRRGRTLTDEDINHYQRVLVALNETIPVMAQIDTVIEEHGGWPLVGSQDHPKPDASGGLPFA